MPKLVLSFAILLQLALSAAQTTIPAAVPSIQDEAVAEVYFWKAKPGKVDEYNRYIREFAEPIDMDARSHGAFVSVTTWINPRADAPWTHMRVFILRNRAQQAGLAAALDAAKLRLHPDEAERTRMADYAETLRDLAGHETLAALH